MITVLKWPTLGSAFHHIAFRVRVRVMEILILGFGLGV